MIEHRTERLRNHPHLVNIDNLLLPLAGGIGQYNAMFPLQKSDYFILLLPIVADRQTCHQIDRNMIPHQAGGGVQSQCLGVTADELSLVESEEAHIALSFRKIANEERFSVHLDQALSDTGYPSPHREPT